MRRETLIKREIKGTSERHGEKLVQGENNKEETKIDILYMDL